MTEFKIGIFKFLKQQLYHSSAYRAVAYTIGHIIIAATCNFFITGAIYKLALIDAVVEPMINGLWYYVLDKTWSRKIYGN